MKNRQQPEHLQKMEKVFLYGALPGKVSLAPVHCPLMGANACPHKKKHCQEPVYTAVIQEAHQPGFPV